MSDEDGNTCTRQTSEQPEGGDERASEVTQPPKRGRRSTARMARNMEVMAQQMLEMQKYAEGLMPPAALAYPPYQPQGYEYQCEDEEEDIYSYALLDRPGTPFRENE
ncbi:hypothetical protein Fot_07269 [Forsythia ovata]|uniref:Uncharacterized protein n=1 Tax=Forsythia ovata TaxID=205694 RepID=A0ABD1WVB0_9LAMI